MGRQALPGPATRVCLPPHHHLGQREPHRKAGRAQRLGTRPWAWSEASGRWLVLHPSREHGLQAAAPGENVRLREDPPHQRHSLLTCAAGERKPQGTPFANGGAGSPGPTGSDAVPRNRAVQAEVSDTGQTTVHRPQGSDRHGHWPSEDAWEPAPD